MTQLVGALSMLIEHRHRSMHRKVERFGVCRMRRCTIQAAHGGLTITDRCRCGAIRVRHINRQHTESTGWRSAAHSRVALIFDLAWHEWYVAVPHRTVSIDVLDYYSTDHADVVGPFRSDAAARAFLRRERPTVGWSVDAFKFTRRSDRHKRLVRLAQRARSPFSMQ
jgi:hypothetical protein